MEYYLVVTHGSPVTLEYDNGLKRTLKNVDTVEPWEYEQIQNTKARVFYAGQNNRA